MPGMKHERSSGPTTSQEPASTRRTYLGQDEKRKPGSSEAFFMSAVDKAATGDEQTSQHEYERKLHSFLYRAGVRKRLQC